MCAHCWWRNWCGGVLIPEEPRTIPRLSRNSREEPPLHLAGGLAEQGESRSIGATGALFAPIVLAAHPEVLCPLVVIHAAASAIQVVLTKERDGDWVAIESAIRVLALLNEVREMLYTRSCGASCRVCCERPCPSEQPERTLMS